MQLGEGPKQGLVQRTARKGLLCIFLLVWKRMTCADEQHAMGLGEGLKQGLVQSSARSGCCRVWGLGWLLRV
jgi:hypothetical protein